MSKDSFLERHRPRQLGELLGNEFAKRILRRLVTKKDLPYGILLHGPKGCGKTSLATIVYRALGCSQGRQTGDPCLTCFSCLHLDGDKHFKDTGILRIYRNCSETTLADVAADFALAEYAHELIVLHYDEFQRASARIQDDLVTLVERCTGRVFLIISTPEATSVDEALRQRLISVPVTRPSTTELVEHLEAICGTELIKFRGIRALAEIATSSGLIPRQALTMLETLTYLTGDAGIDVSDVQLVTGAGVTEVDPDVGEDLDP